VSESPARGGDREEDAPAERDRAYRLAGWAFAVLVLVTIILLAAGIFVSWLRQPDPVRPPQGAGAAPYSLRSM
jgi:hypothetical protein